MFINAIKSNQSPFINGDGEQTRDFTYVQNAVQANILAMLTKDENALNQVYNIAVGDNITLNILFESLVKLARVEGLSAKYREARVGDVRDSLADISKAKQLLGYNPSITVLQGLELTLKNWKGI